LYKKKVISAASIQAVTLNIGNQGNEIEIGKTITARKRKRIERPFCLVERMMAPRTPTNPKYIINIHIKVRISFIVTPQYEWMHKMCQNKKTGEKTPVLSLS